MESECKKGNDMRKGNVRKKIIVRGIPCSIQKVEEVYVITSLNTGVVMWRANVAYNTESMAIHGFEHDIGLYPDDYVIQKDFKEVMRKRNWKSGETGSGLYLTF